MGDEIPVPPRVPSRETILVLYKRRMLFLLRVILWKADVFQPECTHLCDRVSRRPSSERRYHVHVLRGKVSGKQALLGLREEPVRSIVSSDYFGRKVRAVRSRRHIHSILELYSKSMLELRYCVPERKSRLGLEQAKVCHRMSRSCSEHNGRSGVRILRSLKRLFPCMER